MKIKNLILALIISSNFVYQSQCAEAGIKISGKVKIRREDDKGNVSVYKKFDNIKGSLSYILDIK